jgi:hypothetical protein
VALAPDVIVGQTTPVIRALRQATSSIPIVMAAVNDPVEQGFVRAWRIRGETSPVARETCATGITLKRLERLSGRISDIALAMRLKM